MRPCIYLSNGRAKKNVASEKRSCQLFLSRHHSNQSHFCSFYQSLVYQLKHKMLGNIYYYYFCNFLVF